MMVSLNPTLYRAFKRPLACDARGTLRLLFDHQLPGASTHELTKTKLAIKI